MFEMVLAGEKQVCLAKQNYVSTCILYINIF